MSSTSCRDGGGESQPGVPRIDSNTANDRDSHLLLSHASLRCAPQNRNDEINSNNPRSTE